MKSIRFFAILALALTLAGCKKGEADNSSQYFGTIWKGEVQFDIDDDYYGKNEFRYEFFEGKKVVGEAVSYKITKAWSVEKTGELKASGSFSVKGDNVTITLEEPISGYESSDNFPVIFKGTVNDDKMTLWLNDASIVLTKVTLPEV